MDHLFGKIELEFKNKLFYIRLTLRTKSNKFVSPSKPIISVEAKSFSLSVRSEINFLLFTGIHRRR